MATFRSLLLPHQATTDNFWREFLAILVIHPPRVLYSIIQMYRHTDFDNSEISQA
jgi:hypothetical protein